MRSTTSEVLAALLLASCCLQLVQAARRPGAEQQLHDQPPRKQGFVTVRADGGLAYVDGAPSNALEAGGVIAEGSYSDMAQHKSNFGQLRITTHPGRDDMLQLRAAGFLEGYLTAERLFDYVYNYNYWFASKGNGTQVIKAWLAEQDRWIREQAAGHVSAASAAAETRHTTDQRVHGYEHDLVDLGVSGQLHRSNGHEVAGKRRGWVAGWMRAIRRSIGWATAAGGWLGGSTAESRRRARHLRGTLAAGQAFGEVFGEASGSGGFDATGDAATGGRIQEGPHQEGLRSEEGLRQGFWYAVSLSLQQLDGIREGYNARVAEQGPGSGMSYMKHEALLLINAYGDLDDLIPMFVTGNDVEVTQELDKLSPLDAWHRLQTSGHCSALVKVTGDLSDIMIGHTTWSTYYSMIRLYKHYDFTSLSSTHARGKKTSFPSYPGTITSIDDFYILLPTNMVVLETTNNVYNKALYHSVSYRSALSYQRVFAANLVAGDGVQWVEAIQLYPSGTYNNQWMVVDLKRFKPGTELQRGLLTVIELLPGYTLSADVTHELERGFWPSYNVPYFREVYDRAGYPAMAAVLTAKGPDYAQVVGGLSYQLAPRAKIFRRDAGAVESLQDLARVLRQGRWRNDTYTNNDVWGTICARGDLDPKKPKPYGCLDAKLTSYAMALESSALAISGPSAEDGLPPFSWSAAAAFASGPHRGMPDTYSGEMELQQP